MEQAFKNAIPAHIDYLTLTPNDDAPWTITIDITKPNIKERLERAMSEDFNGECKITNMTFSRVSMLGSIEYSLTDDKGETHDGECVIGATAIY